MSLKPKIEITSESDFREKVWLTEPVTLEWAEWKVVQATQGALDSLKTSMEWQASTKKQKLAEEFIRANEKKDAIEKLTDKLGDNLLKNPAVLATAGAAATAVGAVVVGLDKKAKEITGEDVGLMDTIRDWLKEAIKESESGFMKWLWTILYEAFNFFRSEETDTPSPVAQPKPEIHEVPIDNSKLLYVGSYSGLIVFHQTFVQEITKQKDKARNKSGIQDVFAETQVKNLPYTKAQFLYEKYKSNPRDPNIKSDIGITKSNISPEYVVGALGLISDKKLFTTKAFEKSTQGNTVKTVWEVLTELHGDFSIASDFEKVSPDLTMSPDMYASQIFGDISSRYALHTTGEKKWQFVNKETQEQARNIGITPKVLSEILVSKIDINKVSISEIENKDFSPETKEFLRKLYTFWSQSKTGLSEHFSFGKSAEYKAFYDGAIIHPISLMKLFLVSSGHTDLQNLSWPRKMWVYAIIRESFFDGTPENKEKWAQLFNKSILELATVFLSNSPEKIRKMIDPETEEAMRSLLLTAGENTLDASFWMAKNSWEALPESWKITTGVWVIAWLMILWRLRALKWIGLGAAIGAGGAASAFAGAVFVGLSPENQKKFPKERIEEDFKKWLMNLESTK